MRLGLLASAAVGWLALVDSPTRSRAAALPQAAQSGPALPPSADQCSRAAIMTGCYRPLLGRS